MIQLKNVEKHYNNFDLQVSMEVPDGAIIGLIGQNGAGKSTTFKALLGLLRINGGSVVIDGLDMANAGDKEWIETKLRIGVAMAETGFPECLTPNDVRKTLKGLYPKFDEQKFCSLANRLQLPMDKSIEKLSNGNKAKLKVISTLCHDADILVLDEPTAGLDVVARDQLLELLRDYMAEKDNRSMIISSHISSDLEGLCDSLYLIHQGEIVLQEDTDVLLSEYAVLKLKEEEFHSIDRSHIMRSKKEAYGYACLTNQKHFYMENYPQVVIENGNVDELITMMVLGGE